MPEIDESDALKVATKRIATEEMNIDKAIEILEDLDTTLPQFPPEKRRQATKLGIEALKAWKEHTGSIIGSKAKGGRDIKIAYIDSPFGGETEKVQVIGELRELVDVEDLKKGIQEAWCDGNSELGDTFGDFLNRAALRVSQLFSKAGGGYVVRKTQTAIGARGKPFTVGGALFIVPTVSDIKEGE